MKLKKAFLVLCALVLVAVCAVSCKKTKSIEECYLSVPARHALHSSVKLSLNGASFHSFLNRGLIKVSDQKDGNPVYGVMNDAGETILPTEYTSLYSLGDFLVAEGGEVVSRHYVFSLKGTLLYTSDDAVEVKDVGDGYFAVSDGENCSIYNQKGENVLPGTRLDATYAYSACGDFILAKSATKGTTFVFHALTSNILFSFFDNETTKHLVAYVGGNDFIVVKSEETNSSDYDVALTRGGESGVVYYKQTVRRYTSGVATPTTLEIDRFIVQVTNKYTVGLTEQDRENFALKSGYQGVGYYVTDGKSATGALSYYIGDSGLKQVRALPEGVSPWMTFIDGTAVASSSSGAIVFFNQNGEVTGKIEDAVYQNVVFSGEVVTASKMTESGVVRLGAFDKKGNLVLPFEYSYISSFVGDKAVASKGGKAYLVTASGAETYIGDYSMPHYFDGFYQVQSGSFVGANSFDGVALIAPSYQSFEDVRRYGDSVYVALSIGSVTDVYRLY